MIKFLSDLLGGGISLHEAAESGNIAELKRLIARRADVNAKGAYGMTPLHYAARDGKTETALVLVNAGADVNAKNDGDETPLHLTAYHGRTETALAFVNAGANIGAKDYRGWTPLDLATRQDKTETVLALVKAEAGIVAKDNAGYTPLHLAVYLGYTETVFALVKAGADVNAKDSGGQTPLHRAAYLGKTEIALVLVKYGADIVAKDNDDWTPLHVAAALGKTEIALALVKARADILAKDNDGYTPLHIAARYGLTQIALAFIKAGADANAEDGRFSALHRAIEGEQSQTALAFINAGLDVNAKGSYGFTPLHIAAMIKGQTGTAFALIKAGADIEAKDNIGSTPLHLAAVNGHAETVLALIKAGADIGAKDKYDRTPLHIAEQDGQTETANALFIANAQRENAVRAAIERGEADHRHRVLEIERAALRFAIATPDSEFRHGGELNVVTADCAAPQKIKAHAHVFPSTISRIDAEFEAARVCYAAHGFYCVAENYGKRVRLFSGIAGESVVNDFLIFAGNPQELRPIYAKAFFAYYGVKPTIDIVKRRKIARGELPKGAGDCPIYHFRGREGAKPGYVYVASSPLGNPVINGEGLYKIGMTEDTIDKRMKGLNNTSVLHPFEPNLALATQDAKEAEKKIHRALDRWRVKDNREFFRISAKELEFQLRRLTGINIKLY
ncbi:MAG: ankyrin repeat domain-containing protein [Gammaproteobacteria bacterium]